MREKIKQKGFIQIPLLIAIIVAVVVVSVATTGVVLHKQGKLASFTANISEVFKRAEKPTIIDSERETEPQESKIEKEQEVTQESNKATEEEIKRLKEIIKNQSTDK